MADDPTQAQRRKPSQARSRATWEAIVEAASQILERQGPAALSTSRVAERAGVSIGTLYQYFPDKLAILAAALRREFGAEAGRRGTLIQALVGAVEARPARPRRSRWERRCAELVDHVVEFLTPAPALQPIPIPARRRRDY